MPVYSSYKLNNGKFFGVFSTKTSDSSTFPLDLSNDGYIEGSYMWDEYYILSGVPTARPDNTASADKLTITADGVDSITISNIPNPTELTFNDDGIYTVTDGTFEFTIDTPGEYVVSLSSFPYKDTEFTINAS